MIITTLALFFLILFSPVSHAINIPAGEPAPDFKLTSLDGEKYSLSEKDGKITVIIYWRTEHKRSLLALKDATKVLDKLKGKDIRVISIVSENDTQALVKTTFSENEIEFPVVVDYERQFYSDYGIRVYPTTIIIDNQGVIAHSIPGHPLIYKQLFEGYLKKALGEIDEAMLNKMLSPKNKEIDPNTLDALRQYNLAMKFIKSGMVGLATDSAKRAVAAKPDLLKSHILLGFLYLELNEPDNALGSFNKALELNPNSNDAKTGQGGALVMKGDLDKAIEILKSAAIANPYVQMTYYELGKAFELKGEKDKSLQMYKKAIEKVIHKQILPISISKCK